jgi:hypothetical protein
MEWSDSPLALDTLRDDLKQQTKQIIEKNIGTPRSTMQAHGHIYLEKATFAVYIHSLCKALLFKLSALRCAAAGSAKDKVICRPEPQRNSAGLHR